MNIKKTFSAVLERYISFSGPMIFFLFDTERKLVVSKECCGEDKDLAEAALQCGEMGLLEVAAESSGLDFVHIPLAGFSEGGFLGALFKPDLSQDQIKEYLLELRGVLRSANHMGEKVKLYRLLYEVTKEFHTSMDVEKVLQRILDTLNELYPSFDHRLLLSHDKWSENTHLPIDHLEYETRKSDDPALTAYQTGIMQYIEKQESCKTLFVPLRGKQGVYGVMKVAASVQTDISSTDIELIELLAGTGGNALENAQLYEQSQRYISDLKLINKTTRQLNSNLRLSQTTHFMAAQIIRSFQAEEVGFIFFREHDEIEVLGGSTAYFSEKVSRPFVNFISARIKVDGEPLFIGDLEQERLVQTNFRSILGIPMVQDKNLQGMVVVLHNKPYHFTFDHFKLLQSLVHHSTLAFTNSILHEKLQKMVVTDYLTGLYSRHHLDEQIQLSLNRDGFGCFILLDIDDFKVINDTYGHQVGDEVLIQVSDIIRKNIRKVDIAARWGGEEIAVYLPRIGRDLGLQIAKRLVHKVNEGTNPKTTVSCGITLWNSSMGKDSIRKLFNRADKALYSAKEAGKNQVIFESATATNSLN